MSQYNFTVTWFDDSELKKYIGDHISPDQDISFLEIGSYEGASACFISDNYLNGDKSTLTCVDPFDISDSTSPVYSNMKNIFKNNVTASKNWNKIRLRQMYSNEFYKVNNKKYSFIYIDGSHLLEDIKMDFINCLNILDNNGIMWMDDYGSSAPVTELINSLHDKYKDNLIIIHKGYQIAFRKIAIRKII